MKSLWHLGVIATALALNVSTVSAGDIIANLENPPANGAISGIGLISGWAYSQDEGEDITVYLRLDGVTRKDIEIPCCGQRPDVEAAHSDAPEDTGFGLLHNFAEFSSSGPHTIGVDIRSSDAIDDIINNEDRKVIDHSVIVVRPGNTNLISSISLSGAMCAIAPGGNGIQVNGAQLNTSGGSASTSLELMYVPGLQGMVIAGDSNAPTVTQFVAHLNGSQQVPFVKTSATGEATITLNSNNSLTCIVTTTDLGDANAAHIHLAPAGKNGAIILPLTGGPSTWTCPSTALTADQVTALREARMYVNVHTPDHPDGEARGQIVAAPL